MLWSDGSILSSSSALLLMLTTALAPGGGAFQAAAPRALPGTLTSRGVRQGLPCQPEIGRGLRAGRQQPANMMAETEDTGIFGGLFSGMFGGVEEASPDKARVVNAISSPAGWDLSLDIGSQIAKQLGGTGELAKGDAMSVNIGVAVQLTMDEGFDPPQGSVFILSDSKIFKGEGFWSVLEDTDEGVPTVFQANLKCPEGITVSGDLVIPPGNVYVNMQIKDEPPQEGAVVRGLDGVSFYNGRLTVKEDVKSSFMLTPYNGILAEFKIVGTCSAKHRVAQ